MAPRISARSERLFWRLAVIEGNMCSQGYGPGRTEKLGASGILEARIADPTVQSRTRAERVQPILQRASGRPSVGALGPLLELDLVRLAADRLGELVVQAVRRARDLVERVEKLAGLERVAQEVVARDQDPVPERELDEEKA